MDGILWALFISYPILQVLIVLKTNKWWRIFSILPLLPMAYVIFITIIGYNQSSNLWPIIYLFTAPIAILYLVILFIVYKVVMKRKVMDV